MFKNKTVWITGASSGIGEALAYEFAANDANLILSARNEEALNRVRENCTGSGEKKVVLLDISDHDNVFKIAKEVLEAVAKIDILVNNAGISQRALVKDTAFEVDKRLIDVNFLGTVALTKAVLPSMIKNNSGHFVVISSVMGKYSSPLRSSYSASKHALHGFFDSLRAEVYENNIAVTLVCPGYVNTNISINALSGDGEKTNEMDETTAAGISPEILAKKIIKAINNKKREVYFGKKEKLAIYIKRFFPGLLAGIIRKVKVT